jgi:hypothetical protein
MRVERSGAEVTSIGIGHSDSGNSRLAGRQCIERALGAVPGGVAWVLAFCGGKFDPTEFLDGIRSMTGAPVVGGSAAGTITGAARGYGGLEAAVAVFPRSLGDPTLLTEDGLLSGEAAAGRRLGQRLAQATEGGEVVLLFYDSVASAAPHRLHPASALVEGIHDGLAGREIVLLGAGMLTDLNLSDGYIFDGSAARKHAATAVVLPRAIGADTSILHGCIPVSSFLTVTAIEGAELFELDGRPALDVLEERLGRDRWNDRPLELSLAVTLGQKQGDLFARYDENAYVNRLILTVDRERRSVTLFEPDFRPGSQVQIMSRDNGLMLASVRDGTAALVEQTAGRDTLLWLYFDCAGRASGRSGAEIEEAGVLVDGLPAASPLLGFYSGVEVAPVAGGPSRSLDWTGVLTSLYQRAAAS